MNKAILLKENGDRINVHILHTSPAADIDVLTINDPKWGDKRTLKEIAYEDAKDAFTQLNEETGLIELNISDVTKDKLLIKPAILDRACKWDI